MACNLNRRLLVLASSVCFALALPGLAPADPSAPDPGFDGDGIVIQNLGGLETGGAVVQLSTGKLLQLGRGTGSVGEARHALTRYDLSGAVDGSFGTGGTATGHFGRLEGFRLLPGDELLVAGDFDTGSLTELNDAALMRYTASGAKDAGFGTDGRVTFRLDPVTPASEYAADVEVLKSGKLLVGGNIVRSGANVDLVVVRLTAAGALDTTFGNQGYFSFDHMGGVDRVAQVHELADGSILVYGEAQNTVALASPSEVLFLRLTSEGVLDQSFGAGGTGVVTIRTDVNSDTPGTMTPLKDGNFLFSIVGTAKWTAGLLGSDGVLVDGFGTGGIASLTPVLAGTSFPAAQAVSVARQSDGKIVVGGWLSGSTPAFTLIFDVGLARFDSDGLPDTTFNNGSAQRIYTITEAAPEKPINTIVQDDGRIVIAGFYPNGADDRFMLRVTGEEPVVSSSTTSSTLPPTTTLECMDCDVCGDANGDGSIRASDALITLRAAVGQLECALARCDANGDGKVRAGDALRLLQFAVGLAVELLCSA